AVAKIDFVNEARFPQVAQRVVNGCVADTGQAPARRLEDVAGGRMIVAFLDHLKNRFSLGSQPGRLLGNFHSRFRLILNPEIVKRWLSVSNDWVTTCIIDDAIDITLEWRAVNVMHSEQLLRLT